MKDGTIGVLVVEDDDDFCFLIGDTLGREPDMRILGSTASGEEAVYLAQRLDPDIVLMDLNLSLEDWTASRRRAKSACIRARR